MCVCVCAGVLQPIEANGDMAVSPLHMSSVEAPGSPPLLFQPRDHMTTSPALPGLPPFMPPPPGVPFMPPPPGNHSHEFKSEIPSLTFFINHRCATVYASTARHVPRGSPATTTRSYVFTASPRSLLAGFARLFTLRAR